MRLYSTRNKFWEQKLFEWGFPEWLIKRASGSDFDWTTIIRDLFAGRVKEDSGNVRYEIPHIIQNSMLSRLTALALTECTDAEDSQKLRLSLQLDGFEISKGHIVPIEGPVSATKERSRLLAKLDISQLPRKSVISKQLGDAEDFFSTGKCHPAMGEARSALQASIEDTVSLVEARAKRRAGGGVKNQVDFLAKEQFLSPDEQQAFLSAWGFLSAGSHPGLPPDDVGRVGLILCLEFVQILLIRAENLL